jgi:putative ABC transport system substrate-binding protein
LRQLGYVEGKNITIEFRLAKTVNQLPELAAELVRMNVDVIFALSSTEVEAARQATNTIPIVFGLDADPISLGHVASLARPGGNITGLTVIQTDLVAKQLEMLKEAVPQAMRIGVLFSPTAPSHRPAVQAVETAGERLGIQLIMLPAWTIEDFEGVFSTMSREHAGGFLAVGAPLFGSHRARLAELALAHRLAGTFANKEHVEAGGFISYGPDFNDMVWRAAAYVDKILKGAKPADLPVDQASKYELVINLKTAKAIGLNLSEAFLLRADKVIE